MGYEPVTINKYKYRLNLGISRAKTLFNSQYKITPSVGRIKLLAENKTANWINEYIIKVPKVFDSSEKGMYTFSISIILSPMYASSLVKS